MVQVPGWDSNPRCLVQCLQAHRANHCATGTLVTKQAIILLFIFFSKTFKPLVGLFFATNQKTVLVKFDQYEIVDLMSSAWIFTIEMHHPNGIPTLSTRLRSTNHHLSYPSGLGHPKLVGTPGISRQSAFVGMKAEPGYFFITFFKARSFQELMMVI